MSNPLRILHIDSGREWRGGQRQVFLLARTQRDRGDEPLVIGQPEAPLVRRLRGSGLAAASVRMRGEWDLYAARRLRAHVRAWRPHIVHAHDARSHGLALAALLGMRSVPLVVTRRVAFVPRGRIKYGRRVARFIAISNAVRAAMASGGVDERRIDVVYSGVPRSAPTTPRNWRREHGWPDDAVVAGLVGAMTAEKGVHLLESIVAAMSPVARGRTRLVLLGGQAAGVGTISGVPTLRAGFVDEIAAAMAGLDVLWHPSAAEGLGTSVIDAMALGVPPVAFGVGGLPELIEDGNSGLLVPAGDSAAFGRACASLVEDEALRKRLGQTGPLRAAQFSVDTMVTGARAVYQRVLAEQQGGKGVRG